MRHWHEAMCTTVVVTSKQRTSWQYTNDTGHVHVIYLSCTQHVLSTGHVIYLSCSLVAVVFKDTTLVVFQLHTEALLIFLGMCSSVNIISSGLGAVARLQIS